MRQGPTKLPSDGSVDAGLMLLELVMPKGIELTLEDIAFVCGCSMQNIQQIERRAMAKIKQVFEAHRSLGEI